MRTAIRLSRQHARQLEDLIAGLWPEIESKGLRRDAVVSMATAAMPGLGINRRHVSAAARATGHPYWPGGEARAAAVRAAKAAKAAGAPPAKAAASDAGDTFAAVAERLDAIAEDAVTAGVTARAAHGTADKALALNIVMAAVLTRVAQELGIRTPGLDEAIKLAREGAGTAAVSAAMGTPAGSAAHA